MPQPYDLQTPDLLGSFYRGKQLAFNADRAPVEAQQNDQLFQQKQEGFAQEGRQGRLKELSAMARYLSQIPAQARPQVYASMRPKLDPIAQEFGLPPAPAVWDESHLPELEQLASLGGEEQQRWQNLGNGYVMDGQGNVKQAFEPPQKSRARPIMVPDGRGGQVQMLFDPDSQQIRPMNYGDGQEAAQDAPQTASRPVQFDFAPGTSPEVEAATRAAAGVMDPGATEVGGGVTQAPQTASAGGYGGLGYKPPPAPRQASNPPPASAPGNTGLSGDDYLATLPPEMRGLVKAIAAGDSPAPSASSRSPQAQALLQAVYLYDPSASSINLNARGATRRDFTAGKSAQNLRSLNQAIGHLGVLKSQISGVAGHSVPVIGQLLNKAENAYAENSGDPGITNYKQTAEALAGELTQVFRGNAGAEADIVRNLEHLSAAQSVEQKNAAVKNIVALLNSRIEELGQQYSQGMGKTTDPYSLLNKHAAEVLRDIQGVGKKAGGSVEYVRDASGKLVPKGG